MTDKNYAHIIEPTREEVEEELAIERYRTRYLQAVRSTIGYIIVAAALAVIISMLIFPVLRITGTSMTDTLNNGDVVILLRGKNFKTGDVVAFYYNNNLLIKRVIATSGQWVDIAENGAVYVDGNELEEPYVSELAMGDCNIALPYQVPEDRVFVMGDHRSTSLDSRNTALGCVSEDMVVGRAVFRFWPLLDIGPVS